MSATGKRSASLTLEAEDDDSVMSHGSRDSDDFYLSVLHYDSEEDDEDLHILELAGVQPPTCTQKATPHYGEPS